MTDLIAQHCGSMTCPKHNFGGVNKDEVCRMDPVSHAHTHGVDCGCKEEKPFFTSESIAGESRDGWDMIPVDAHTANRLMEVLNAKVAPLLAEVEKLKAEKLAMYKEAKERIAKLELFINAVIKGAEHDHVHAPTSCRACAVIEEARAALADKEK